MPQNLFSHLLKTFWTNRNLRLPSISLGLITLYALFITFLFVIVYASLRELRIDTIQSWVLTLAFFFVIEILTFVYVRYVCLPLLGFRRALRVFKNAQTNGKTNGMPSGYESNGWQKESRDKDQAEINALQSQLNPHFLYNTLESLRGQAVVDGLDEIAEMIEALSSFYRYNVSQSSKLVTLADELWIVDNYFLILQYRFGKKFRLVKMLEEEDDCLKYTLPKLSIQPLVENAIFHGLEPKLGEGCVTIRITVTEKRLIIHIEDDGVGIEKAKLDALNESFHRGMRSVEQPGSSGIGLFNIDRRIKLNYGEGYGLIVYSTPDVGTDVEITLPLVR